MNVPSSPKPAPAPQVPRPVSIGSRETIGSAPWPPLTPQEEAFVVPWMIPEVPTR